MRYLLGLLGVVGLIIVVVILVIRGFSGDDAKVGPSLTQYTDTATVMRFTTEAPINADKIHQAVRITVGRNESKAEILQGYNDTVANTATYPSNPEAYGVFLRALDLLGFSKGNDDPTMQDERGFCADGNLYTLEIMENGRQIQRYWKTSCDEGNFVGELGKIDELFQAQIPDLGNFMRDVNLR
ncbi:MAG TPA: hypothetical protein VFB59_04075 [Candidatus Saccharimonadales bacterium]|nr:hypothetical protein [Candidatus Saccharimonadales bacterium]